MKTVIHFKDGSVEFIENSAPSIQMEDRMIGFVDSSMSVIADDIPVDEVKQVIWNLEED